MPIPLRSDYDAGRVRAAARESKNANQVRRLLALAAIYDGAPRAEAAEIGGVTRQIIRQARHAALCSPGSPHRIGLYFRCYLSSAGKSRRADPAMVQY